METLRCSKCKTPMSVPALESDIYMWCERCVTRAFALEAEKRERLKAMAATAAPKG